MATDVRFAVLGPLEVTRAGQPVSVGPAKVRALLAILLLRANQVVSVADIAERVWGQARPANARRAVQLYVVRLRQALGGVGDVIATRPGGYRIQVGPDQLDQIRFDGLVREADDASATGALALESRLLGEALALWRGPVLADVDCEQLHLGDVPAIAERRLLTEERWVEVELRRGRHAGLVPRLRQLTTANPFRERLWAQLMLALFRGGRQAEALETYRAAADELGLDPSEDLQRLHTLILTGDPSLSAPPTPSQRCDLPRDVSHFTGRTDEILRVLEAPRSTTATAGVTLRAAGVSGEHIPEDQDDRAAMWRARLADRRAVIVLDNAVDNDQIQPLLPGAPNCLVLITSRRRLLGLDGTHLMSLDVMPPRDAADLFARVVGDARPPMEPAAVTDVLELCGFLPLAVRIAAARLRHRPVWTVRQLATRLRDQRQRLAELHAGGRDVAAVFSVSYHHLPQGRDRGQRDRSADGDEPASSTTTGTRHRWP